MDLFEILEMLLTVNNIFIDRQWTIIDEDIETKSLFSLSARRKNAVRLEHKAGHDIIYELSVRLYPTPLESFREAISNALDEGSKKVEIRTLTKEIIVEDWGEGIKDVEKFATFGEAAKAKLGGEIIGEKGLGKLSLLRLGDNVNFRTNNGEFGVNIMMTPQFLDADYGAVNKFLDHKGTQIIIQNPRSVPPTDELSNYLKRAFGLRIAKGVEIVLNGVMLEARSRIDATEHFILRLKGGVEVTGNIKEDKKAKGSLDVYIKHVFVTTIVVDPERRFTGWVNCSALTPTTARNDIVKTSDPHDVYFEFIGHLKHYCTRFAKTQEELGQDEIRMGNELSKLLKSYLKDMRLFHQGIMGVGKDGIDFNDKQFDRKPPQPHEPKEEKEEHDYVKMHYRQRTNKPIKRTQKTDYGVMWVDQDYGNEKEPLFYVEPNLIIRNRTNDLYKFALKNKPSLGPKWLRLVPFLARLAVSLNPESLKWNREQTNLATDQATRYFLKHQGEL